ncbi:hypothetical protein STEG23_031843 [Scotinomys teguina]
MEPGGRARSDAPQPVAPGLCRARPAGGGGASSWLLLDGTSWLLCYGFLYLALYAQVSQSKPCERTGSCFSGRCVNSTCLCDPGWVGDQCQHCQGRFKECKCSSTDEWTETVTCRHNGVLGLNGNCVICDVKDIIILKDLMFFYFKYKRKPF